jgi:Tol biopolymer transport system component
VELVTGYNAIWSPDGARVAFAYDFDSDANPIHAIVDLEGQTIASDIRGSSLTWSPDGTRVAVEVYALPIPVAQVIEVATGEVLWDEEGIQPAWRP